MYYFDWVFDESKPLSDFPPELSEAISYCNIKNRAGKILSPAAKQIIGQIVL